MNLTLIRNVNEFTLFRHLLHFCFVDFSCFICYLYLFKHTGVQHDFHIIYFSCHLTVTRRNKDITLIGLNLLQKIIDRNKI